MRRMIGSVVVLSLAGCGVTMFPNGPKTSEAIEISATDWDGDGFSNEDEEATGSDPRSCMEVPEGPGHWADCEEMADAYGLLESPGWQMGQMAPNLRLTDQFGQEVALHQFYGSVVLLELSAGWCGPCVRWARHSQELYEDHKADGLVILEVLTDRRDRSPADLDFISWWSEVLELTYPVTHEATHMEVPRSLYRAGLYEGALPTTVILDRELRVSDVLSGTDYERVDQRLNELL